MPEVAELPGHTVRAIVLAAGAGSRFGGRKLEARIAGKPVLQHVLDALASAGLDDPIVVLAPDSGLEPLITWRGAERVVNPDPSRGMSSSLQLGWATALAADAPPDAVLIVLGDQPRLGPEVVGALIGTPPDPDRPIVAPWFRSGARNPVRIETGPAATTFIQAATGDRGLGPLLDANPDVVRWIDVPGDNPGVDERSDLVAVIEADWADRVRRNREQVERLRETPEDADHYGPVAGLFRDDPRRTGDDILEAVLRHALPGDTWLDVGAGAGRYAFPLALAVREVIAVEPSVAMVEALQDGVREHKCNNVRVVAGRWPEATAALVPLPCADVSFIANVGHDTELIGPFLYGLDFAARRACVAVMQEQPPASVAAPFFEAVHDEARVPLPALPDFVDLLAARGSHPEVEILDRPARAWRTRDEVLTFLRRQTWVAPGSAADLRLQAALDARLTPSSGEAGGLTLGAGKPTRVGVVRWTP
ncbi:MAG: NTP transferase domain-containing protein [Chloroflexi bacterium]|nr:NTP transferase domain-containing protein [Chloroflexota bacterium]